MMEHKGKLVAGFTKEHDINQLVYFETFEDVRLAIQREKSLKRWYRDWKIDLINLHNPEWNDLAEGLVMDPRVKPEDDKVTND